MMRDMPAYGWEPQPAAVLGEYSTSPAFLPGNLELDVTASQSHCDKQNQAENGQCTTA